MDITLEDLIECFKGNDDILRNEVYDEKLNNYTYLFKIYDEDEEITEYFLTDGEDLYFFWLFEPLRKIDEKNMNWLEDYPEIIEQMKNYYRLKKLSQSHFSS